MKFLVYILIFQFSAGACMPKTDFNQLLKFHSLIEHYQLHVEEARIKSESFDVFDFIYLHYISPDGHVHNQPYDHDQLPFKSVTGSLVYCCSEYTTDQPILSKVIINQDFIIETSINHDYNHTIFHPPLRA